MFICSRILKVLPLVTTRWPPQTDSSTWCFIRPQTRIQTWKLEWTNYMLIKSTIAHSRRSTPRTSVQQHETIYFTYWLNNTGCTPCTLNKHEWMETGRGGQPKEHRSGSSVITHIIKSQERFLHFTSHLAFIHIMQNDRDSSFVCDIRSPVYFCRNK